MLNQSQTQPNLFADPGDTTSILFEASPRLTAFQAYQIWMGANGGNDWGGCNVFVSSDGTTYKQAGTIDMRGRLGVLDSTFASGSDPDSTNALVVDMASNTGQMEAGSTADADAGNTVCYVDGEILSYSAATVTGQNQYTFDTYIRRGQYGSTIGSHAGGSNFLRLDDAVFKFTYDPAWGGKTVHFKFQSFNTFGNAAQDLSTLTAVSFAIPGLNSGVPPAFTTSVINPDFEIGSDLPPYGWTVAPGVFIGALTYDTSTPYAGTRSLKIAVIASGPFVQLVNSQQYVVRAGDSYRISAALNLPLGISGAAAQAVFSWRDASGNPISGGASDIVASQTAIGGGWALASASGVAPTGAVAAVVALVVNCVGHTIAEWDSIELTRMASLSADVMGTLPIASVGARNGSISYVIDGGGAVVTTGVKGQLSIPANCTVNGWVITADQSGSAVVDVLRSTYSGFPTTSSIAGTDKPTLSSAQKNQDSTLTGWGSTSLSAGDILQFNVNSCSTCTRLIVTLNVSITG